MTTKASEIFRNARVATDLFSPAQVVVPTFKKLTGSLGAYSVDASNLGLTHLTALGVGAVQQIAAINQQLPSSGNCSINLSGNKLDYDSCLRVLQAALWFATYNSPSLNLSGGDMAIIPQQTITKFTFPDEAGGIPIVPMVPRIVTYTFPDEVGGEDEYGTGSNYQNAAVDLGSYGITNFWNSGLVTQGGNTGTEIAANAAQVISNAQNQSTYESAFAVERADNVLTVTYSGIDLGGNTYWINPILTDPVVSTVVNAGAPEVPANMSQSNYSSLGVNFFNSDNLQGCVTTDPSTFASFYPGTAALLIPGMSGADAASAIGTALSYVFGGYGYSFAPVPGESNAFFSYAYPNASGLPSFPAPASVETIVSPPGELLTLLSNGRTVSTNF